MRPKHVIFEAKTLLVSGEAMLCRGEVFLVKGSIAPAPWGHLRQRDGDDRHLRGVIRTFVCLRKCAVRRIRCLYSFYCVRPSKAAEFAVPLASL